jgi:hypothetical protein
LKPVDLAEQSKRSLPAPLSQLSPLAHDFVSVGLGNYLESFDFISKNSGIVAQSHIDALVSEALAAAKAGQSIRSQTCIHQALLLRHCKTVGPNNIGTFFRNLIAGDGKIKENFLNDAKKVYFVVQEKAARAPYQTQVARGPGRRIHSTDPEGNLLQPASSRHHEPDRYGSPSDPIESDSNTTGADAKEGRKNATKAEAGGGNDKHTPSQASIFHHTAEPLPTLPENRRLETTKISGTGGSVEMLDHREYLPVTSQTSSYR